MRKAGEVVSVEDAHEAFTLTHALLAPEIAGKFNTGPVRATRVPARTCAQRVTGIGARRGVGIDAPRTALPCPAELSDERLAAVSRRP